MERKNPIMTDYSERKTLQIKIHEIIKENIILYFLF